MGSLRRATYTDWANGLGSDSLTFFGVALFLRLIKVEFDPALDKVFLAADEANFDGYAAGGGVIAAAVRATANDAATGERLIVIPPATNGNRWETTGITALPQVVYGFALSTDSVGLDTADIMYMDLLDEPVELTAIDQEVDVPLVRLRVNQAAVS